MQALFSRFIRASVWFYTRRTGTFHYCPRDFSWGFHNDVPNQVVDIRKIIDGKLEGETLSDEQLNCLIQCYPYDPEKNKYLLKEGVTNEDLKIIRTVFKRYSVYQQERSFFFFRTEELSRELAGDKIADFFETNDTNRKRLEELNDAIKDDKYGLRCFEYDHLEPVDEKDETAFSRKVANALWSKIEAEIEEKLEVSEEKDWLEEEAEFHELFMADRTQRFVGRKDILDKMHSFCRGDWPIAQAEGVSQYVPMPNVMVISGEPGCGKSALFARFTEEIMH